MKVYLCMALLTLSITSINAQKEYKGSTFDSVWSEVLSDPYEKPQYEVGALALFSWFKKKIEMVAKRTLNDRSDILPPFDKLAHPNGICLSGTWKITEKSQFDGYFSKGSEALIITRASTALDNTKRGENRAMAIAGKIFPTMDKDAQVKTVSFFVVDDLGGTKAPRWTGVEMTNEPKISKTLELIKNIVYGLRLQSTFRKADKNEGIRQLYQIAELKNKSNDVTTPKWMMIKAAPNQGINAEDFRDELNIDKIGKPITLEIHVSSTDNHSGVVSFQRIGHIELTESVISKSCDKRLHFSHPKWRDDLKHSNF